VPSAWGSAYRVGFQVGSSAIGGVAGAGASDYFSIGGNYYLDNTPQYIYRTSTFANRFEASVGEFRWFTAPSGTAGNAISFTQAMTLTAGGDLGIANTSPSYRVDIEGSSGSISTVRVKNGAIGASDGSQILLGNSANFTNAYLRLNGGGNSSQGGAGSLNIGLTESAAMTFLTANTERLRITSGGNVAIGGTTADERLHVSSGRIKTSVATTGAAYFLATNTNGSTIYGTDAIGGYILTDWNAPILFYTNNAERMRIKSSGVINISNIPTSSVGLSAGDIWNDGGTLKIV
jgi:hypothetical protein